MNVPAPLRLPMSFARDARFVGGSALSLKLLMVALHDYGASGGRSTREVPGDGHPVRLDLGRLEETTGSRGSVMRRSADAMCDMAATWPEGVGRVSTGLVDYVGGGQREGAPAMHLELSRRFLDHSCAVVTGVHVAVGDLRVVKGGKGVKAAGIRSRCGVLLLLRGLAALRTRDGAKPVRVSLGIEDLVHYTGHEPGAGKAKTAPWSLVRDYLVVGAAEVNATSTDLRVKVLPNGRAPWVATPGAVRERAPHLRHVELVFDHVRATRARAGGTGQVEAAQVDEAA